MGIKFANKASTSLTSGINSSATSIDVADGSVFPALGTNDHFFATLQFLNDSSETEVIKVTAVSGNTLTVDRSIETSKSFSANDIIELRVTSQALADPTLLADGVKLEDGHKIQLGDSDDLQIYHDGSDSFITDTGAGDLYIQGSEVTLKRGADTKLNTTLYGVQVTGRIDATDIDLSGTILSDGFKSDGESTDYNIFSRVNTTHPAIYVQSTGTKIASFATGSVLPNGGTEILAVNSTGIDVTGTVHAQSAVVITDPSPRLILKDSTDSDDHSIRFRGSDDVDNLQITSTSNHLNFITADSNKNILMKPNDATALEVDTTGINVTGTVTADGVKLGDNEKLQFGDVTTPDLEIYHDGSNSRITDQGTGSLIITGEELSLQAANGYRRIHAQNGASGQTLLYYGTDSTSKLATTSAGIDVTGTVTAGGVSLGNNERITLGEESDGKLEIYEAAGGNGVIEQTGSGDIVVKGANGSLRNDSNDAVIAWFPTYAALAYRGASGAGTKLETTATGIDVTGTVSCDTGISIASNADQTDPQPDLNFFNNEDDAVSQRIGQVNFYGKNNLSGAGIADVKYGWQELRTINVTDGEESAQHETWVKDGAGGNKRVLQVQPTGIDVTGTVTCDEALTISSTGAAADAKPDIWLFNNAPAAVDERLGQITWFGKNDVSPEQETVNYAFQEVKTTNVGDGTEQAEMQFHIRNGASHLEVLTLDSSGIDVTGGITSDYLDLTGGKTTTTTGEVALDKIKFSAMADDSATIFAEVNGGITTLVLDMQDDAHELIEHRIDGATPLKVKKTGIDVTGTVEADAFTGHMTSVVSSSAQTIATTNYGVRKIHTGGAVTYTFNETGAISGNDIGKAIVIANAGTDTITCNFTTSKFYKMISGVDADLSGSGASSITIAKGGIAEIVITETNKALVFGAGVA